MAEDIKELLKPIHQLSDEKARDLVNKRYNEAKEHARKQFQVFDYATLAYDGIFSNSLLGNRPFVSKFGIYINVPRTQMTVDATVAQMPQGVIPFEVRATKPSSVGKAQKINNVAKADWRRSGAAFQWDMANFNKILYGTAIVENYLKRELQSVFFLDSVDEEGQPKYKKDTKETYYGMVTRVIDNYDCFPSPNGTCFTTRYGDDRPLDYFIKRSVWEVKALKKYFLGRISEEKLNNLKPGGDLTNFKAVRNFMDFLYTLNSPPKNVSIREYVQSAQRYTPMAPEYDAERFIEVLEYHEDDAYVVVANNEVLVKMPNPYPHKELRFSIDKDYWIPHRFWGRGEAETIRYQQIEENRIHNLILDSIYMTIAPMFGVNTAYLKDESEARVEPGLFIHLKPLAGLKISDAIQQLPITPGAVGSGLKLLEEINKITQSSTSVSDFVIGSGEGISKSATEARNLAGASRRRIQKKINNSQEFFIKHIVEQWISCYPFYYNREDLDFDLGSEREGFIKFIPRNREEVSEEEIKEYITELPDGKGYSDVIFLDDLEGDFQVYVDTLPLSSQERLAQWLQVLKVSNETNQSVGVMLVKVGEVVKEVLKNFEVIEDPERFIDSAPQPLAGAMPPGGAGASPSPAGEETTMRSEAQPSNILQRRIHGEKKL